VSAGAPPQTPLGEHTAPQAPLLDLSGPTSKGRGGKVNMTGMGKDREGEERC